ncbi:adenosylmethionine--8-amino-7-oxononanoate transaminase [Thioalkalivibrio sp. ALE20]|uniref:adenosylmethionine--8-amino-7-oxononanoate transaminase n=1 Tax=Thioalkalivibrio sp. ALE20 TaxID=545275 RepID=UPI00037AE5C3|nr:adenosylmethionine--8-amino-7-oxononanoate transaminase [Thioalkalivibrio sp. ALE20]
MSNEDVRRRDLRALWHPCTQMKDYGEEGTLPLLPIERGEGVWLYDFDGNRYLDAISSWWVNLFGHANPRINDALKDQVDRLEHVILAGCTHEPVVELSERLIDITPAGLDRVFLADNGSAGVEAALKMSFHYWRNVGQPQKTRFIGVSNAYHGETIGALSVSDVPLYRHTYEPLMLDVINVPGPDCFHREPGEDCADVARRQFAHMEQALERHAHEVAAVIIEPLVQCAGHMRMFDPEYLRLLRDACDRHGVHLIADEIAVGFGRTGPLFACEQGPITPDFLCLSKGLTGGYLPMAALLTTDTVYQAFYDDYEKLNMFLHSHSYTGNPLACRAALATLDIFESEPVLERNRELAAHIARRLEPLNDHPHVADVRQHGMIAAVELVQDKASRTPYPWQERRGLDIYRNGLTRGALLRPLGNVSYLMPPYVITEEQIDFLVEVMGEGIDIATRD